MQDWIGQKRRLQVAKHLNDVLLTAKHTTIVAWLNWLRQNFQNYWELYILMSFDVCEKKKFLFGF